MTAIVGDRELPLPATPPHRHWHVCTVQYTVNCNEVCVGKGWGGYFLLTCLLYVTVGVYMYSVGGVRVCVCFSHVT